MDWERFYFEYRLELDQAVVQEIISIEAYREAALNLVLPPAWREQLDKLNRVRAVYGTTALEGNPLSEAEVSKQIESIERGEKPPDHATKEQLQIRNSGIAQEWVRLRFGPNSPPISETDILTLHRQVTIRSDTTHNQPGAYRTFSVQVGTPEMGGVPVGAPAAHVPELMKQYVEFVNSRRLAAQHPVILALLAHFFLVTIHPFGDGNGRVSRLVEAAILYQGGYNVHGFYGLSNYFYRNEVEYKTTLQGCRRDMPCDVTALVLFGLKGFASELKGINSFIKTKLNRVVYRDMLVRAFGQRMSRRRKLLNQREYSLLHFLLTETEPSDPFSDSPSRRISFSELNDSPYVKSAYKSVTQRTFFRELVRLAHMGFIRFVHEGGSPARAIVELDFGAIGKY